MNEQIAFFRNSCAEDGVELTPGEAERFFNAYQSLKAKIEKAVALCPNFYMDLCNSTTEDKLNDLKRLNANGGNMTFKEYLELQSTIKKICEIEGYV